MALCIGGLSQEDKTRGFDKVIVIGIRGTDADVEEQTLRNLIDSHHYSSGISFCDFHTPTNNTGDVQSGYSESTDDYEDTYNTEIKGPKAFDDLNALHKHNAQLLGQAFGFENEIEIFRHLKNSGKKTLYYARYMNTCIWPAAGRFFLADLLNDATSDTLIKSIEDHFTQFVRALGHLPSLRIDTQPYGVLPVTALLPDSPDNRYGWKPSDKDIVHEINWRSFDAKLHEILLKFFELWKDFCQDQNRVPRMADSPDPDRSLISILSMEPVSYKINARPILSDNLQYWIIAALRHSYFGAGSDFEGLNSPEFWAGLWKTTDQQRRDYIARYLAELTGLEEDRIRTSKLLNLFAWNKSDDIDIDFDYFARLSLLLTYNLPDEQEKIKRLIVFLKSTSVLEFLNTVDDPKVIVRRIIDDPHFRKKQPKAYGIREDISEKILQIRDAKENKQLETTQEILDIEGLGVDTLQDLLYSFTNIDYQLLLKFFNTVTSPEEIVRRIKDDPAYIQAGIKTRGVTLSQAEKIMQTRGTLAEKKFSDVLQILAINGIGDDTYHDILFSFKMKTETQNIDLLFNSTLDLFSHRLDAWITSLAYKRLLAMRTEEKRGLYLGAYGWVENLKEDTEPRDNAGYIHAPSRGQAAAGAVLYNAYLTHRENGNSPYKTNLESYRVRKACQIIEGMRQGQPLGALLGYIFESELHDVRLDEYIDEFRAAFPISESEIDRPEEEIDEQSSSASISARNVVNGLSLIRWDEDNNIQDINLGSEQEIDKVVEIKSGVDSNIVNNAISNLKSSFDAVNDLLLYESVYHTIQGNYERAGAFMDARAGKNVFHALESISPPLLGNSFENRVCLFFPKPDEVESAAYVSPRAKTEPRLAKWISTLFNSLDGIRFSYSYRAYKIDINREITNENKDAYLEDLESIPGISTTLAEKILEYKEDKIIKDLDERVEIDGIGGSLDYKLSNWMYLGKDSGEEPFYSPLNINTGSAEDLEKLPGIGLATAQKIVDNRETVGDFRRIGELTKIAGITKTDCDKLRRFCTTGQNVLEFSDLGTDSYGDDLAEEGKLQPIDVFYIASIQPGGGETEIEQRLKYWIRKEHHLNSDDPVELQFSESNAVIYLDLVQLSQQIKKLLSKVSPLRPGDFILPDEEAQSTFSEEDARAFWSRAEALYNDVMSRLNSLADPDDIESKLLKASRFGIPTAVPNGSQRADFTGRTELVIREITKRKNEFDKQKDEISKIFDQENPDYGEAFKEVEKAIKLLLAEDFVVLPEFTTPNPDQLFNLFNQNDLLGDLGMGRVRLWIQQAALTQSSINELENTMLLADALLQTATNNTHFNLRVGQLPYTNGNRWLGLAEDERILFSIGDWHAEALNNGEIPDTVVSRLGDIGRDLSDSAKVLTHSEGQWRVVDEDSEYLLKTQGEHIHVILKSGALNNASIVGVCCGGNIFTDTWLTADKSVCGFKLDGWIETIPEDTVDTSVAFHYDAPNTQPPQSLLLAVPPDRDKKHWEIDDLVRIICDTMELYKIRAVDFEALSTGETDDYLQPIGAFLPTTIVPVDASKKGWKKLGDTDLISEWLSTLE